MQPTDTDLPWLLTLPGLVTAVATSLAAVFTGLAWWSSRYGLRPVVEMAAERQADEPQILKLIITVRNRRPFALLLAEVELLHPKKGVSLFSYHPNTAGGIQRRKRQILVSTEPVAPGGSGAAAIFLVLDDGVKEYSGPMKLAIKTLARSQTIRRRRTTIKRQVELRAP